MTSKLSASRRWLVLPAGIYLTGLPTYYAIVAVGLTGKSAAHARHVGVILFAVWVAARYSRGCSSNGVRGASWLRVPLMDGSSSVEHRP